LRPIVRPVAPVTSSRTDHLELEMQRHQRLLQVLDVLPGVRHQQRAAA
jgi:hypothetical protein